ncbi:MAG TPA: HAD-IIIC family phosphatase [Candidatus Binataceae bacterium]|nr:HAD-IIIC family phosphatase [Candidatus Binataceae bacterium]
MFEFDKYDPKLHREKPATLALNYEPADDVAAIAFLHWGEHCVECAAPACYSSCDLYQPRSDMRCRRFAFGAYKNPSFPSMRGYGVEVSFKKWAKIEAFGDTAVHPVDAVLRWERMVEAGAPIANVVGHLVKTATGKRAWDEAAYIATEKLTRRLNARGSNGPQAEAFLLEVYNPTEGEIRLQVIFGVSIDDVTRNGQEPPLVPPSINTVVLPPGYSRHEIGAQAFHQILDRGVPFKITMVPEADGNGRLVFLSADLVRFKPRHAGADARKIKCVVWDLDNTLWKGTLVEGDDVVLNPGIAELLKHLDERGILLSVVSKNDFDPAWKKLREFGVAEYFLYPQIDWLPKSQKIKNIARNLNIGIDTFAFIDDNQFELDEVASVIPELLPINFNANQIAALQSDPRFQGSVTEESRQRRKMYQQQVAREKEEQGFGDDYLGFLASCGIELEIGGYSEHDSERVAELVQRTNQLNFSGRKYSRDELQNVIANPTLGKYVLRVSDKYGSYGTVGFCLVKDKPDTVEVLDFMLSCRVQSKFVEQALFSHLLAHHNPGGAKAIWVNFKKTDRNTPAHNVLRTIGFQSCDAARDRIDSGMILRTAVPLKCDFIAVRCSAPEGAIAYDENARTNDAEARASSNGFHG